jgi:hypothetical protein
MLQAGRSWVRDPIRGVNFFGLSNPSDCLCGLVVRVPAYRSGGPGFDSRALQEKK